MFKPLINLLLSVIFGLGDKGGKSYHKTVSNRGKKILDYLKGVLMKYKGILKTQTELPSDI